MDVLLDDLSEPGFMGLFYFSGTFFPLSGGDGLNGLEENGERSRRCRRPVGEAVAARVSDERSEESVRQDERQSDSRSPRSAARLVTTGQWKINDLMNLKSTEREDCHSVNLTYYKLCNKMGTTRSSFRSRSSALRTDRCCSLHSNSERTWRYSYYIWPDDRPTSGWTQENQDLISCSVSTCILYQL